MGNKVEHRGVKLIHPPANGKMSNLPCAPLSVAVGELLCVDSSPGFPLCCTANADIIPDWFVFDLNGNDSFMPQIHVERRHM